MEMPPIDFKNWMTFDNILPNQKLSCKADISFSAGPLKPYYFFTAATLAEMGWYEDTLTILYHFPCKIYRQLLKVQLFVNS